MFFLIRGCFVFIVGICSVKTDTEAYGYSGAVNALFGELTEYTTQVLIAKEKMNEFRHETWDRKYAIAMINLYTQPGQFYLTLNIEMKHGYPAVTDVWKRAGDLINRGVDILGPKHFKKKHQVLLSTPTTPTRNQVLISSNVLVNEGGSYNSSTGIFIAPRNGMYQFNAYICGNNNVAIQFDIMVGFIPYAKVYGDDRHNYHCPSSQVVAILKENDTVFVQWYSGTITKGTYQRNQFSSTFIHE